MLFQVMLIGEDKTNEENVLILRHVDGSCTGEAFLFFYQSVYYYYLHFLHIFYTSSSVPTTYVMLTLFDFRLLTRCYEI